LILGAFVAWSAALSSLAGCDARKTSGVELCYRLGGAEAREGRALTPAEAAARTAEAVAVLRKRLPKCDVQADPGSSGRIIIRVFGSLSAEEIESTKRRAEQMGRLEFRIVVPKDDYDKMTPEARRTVVKYELRMRARRPGEAETVVPVYIQTYDKYNITGSMLSRCFPTSDETGAPAVGFQFNSEGARLFGDMTKKLQGKGSIGIILNGKLYSAPFVKSAITSSGIIEGSFKEEEVTEMVTVLQAGSLPAALTLQSEAFVGPELGTDSRERGYFACKLSLLLVVAFMAVYYTLAGGIADLALALNLLFLVAWMMIIGATLTLPGIAGIVLTLGMAVDANVLIYERVREELQQGQTLRTAIKNGYDRAFLTIFDSNLTTLITAVFLYLLGTGAVRGFAVTLGYGIVISMFTSLFITRVVFDILISKGWLKERLVMMKLFSRPSIRWVRRAPLCIGISIVCIIAGMVVFFYRGHDNYSIDFSAGTMMRLRLRGLVAKPSEVKPSADGKGSSFSVSFFERRAGGVLVPAEATGPILAEGLIRLKKLDPKLDIEGVKPAWPEGKDHGTQVELTVPEPAGGTAAGKTLASLIEKQGFGAFRTRMDIEAVRKMVADAGYPAANVQTAFQDEAVVGRRDSDQFTIRVQGKADNETQEQREAIPTNVEHVFGDLVDHKSVDAEVVNAELVPSPDNAARSVARVTLRFVQFDPADNAPMPIGIRRVHIESGIERAALAHITVHWPKEERKYYEEIMFDAPAADKDKIVKQLSAKEAFTFPDAFTGYYFVNPGQAQSIVRRALWASLLSFAGICVYVWLRFGAFKYGIAAVAALVHDVLFTLGFLAAVAWFAETRRGETFGIGDVRLSLDVVAGILTLIGYSINDTIVVFDRIRENVRRRIREMRGKRQSGDVLTPELIDQAINQTLSRTILTSFTTWIVVVTLYIWGGATLHGLALCLIFGIIVGTYSSIAIASPILVLAHAWEARRARAAGELTAEEQEVAMERGETSAPK
jgi:SecD/SecF fusion protein